MLGIILARFFITEVNLSFSVAFRFVLLLNDSYSEIIEDIFLESSIYSLVALSKSLIISVEDFIFFENVAKAVITPVIVLNNKPRGLALTALLNNI